MSDAENRLAHPYVEELHILCARSTDDTSSVNLIIGHLNKIFGRAGDTVFGSMKESFVGTGHERQGYKAGSDVLKAFGSMAKATITGNEEDAEKAKTKKAQAVDSGFAYLSENRTGYTKIEDEAEKRAWG